MFISAYFLKFFMIFFILPVKFAKPAAASTSNTTRDISLVPLSRILKRHPNFKTPD